MSRCRMRPSRRKAASCSSQSGQENAGNFGGILCLGTGSRLEICDPSHEEQRGRPQGHPALLPLSSTARKLCAHRTISFFSWAHRTASSQAPCIQPGPCELFWPKTRGLESRSPPLRVTHLKPPLSHPSLLTFPWHSGGHILETERGKGRAWVTEPPRTAHWAFL